MTNYHLITWYDANILNLSKSTTATRNPTIRIRIMFKKTLMVSYANVCHIDPGLPKWVWRTSIFPPCAAQCPRFWTLAMSTRRSCHLLLVGLPATISASRSRVAWAIACHGNSQWFTLTIWTRQVICQLSTVATHPVKLLSSPPSSSLFSASSIPLSSTLSHEHSTSPHLPPGEPWTTCRASLAWLWKNEGAQC